MRTKERPYDDIKVAMWMPRPMVERLNELARANCLPRTAFLKNVVVASIPSLLEGVEVKGGQV